MKEKLIELRDAYQDALNRYNSQEEQRLIQGSVCCEDTAAGLFKQFIDNINNILN